MRAAVSASVSSVPPASAAAGISTRWSLPSTRRTRCGTIRPTKPTEPTSVTDVAVSSEASTYKAMRRCPTRTPSARAVSSPRASTLRSRANGITTTSASASTATAGHGRAAALASPIIQNSIDITRVSGANASIKDTAAPQPAATMTPVSSSRVCVQLPSPCARPNTTTIAVSAPTKAEASTQKVAAPSVIAPSAATAAPPEMPRM